MALGVDGAPAGRVIWKTALLTLGTVGFVFFLTLMFHSMRAVMDVGGTCAEGGPFEIRQPCPEGAAWIMPVSIFGGLASLGIGAIGVFKQGGPRPYAFRVVGALPRARLELPGVRLRPSGRERVGVGLDRLRGRLRADGRGTAPRVVLTLGGALGALGPEVGRRVAGRGAVRAPVE